MLICLALAMKLSTSASFRSISKIIVLVSFYLELNIKAPSHVTILIWIKKLGIYRLSQSKEKADDWILMIDESIEFGHDKLLVILGIREGCINFKSYLQYEDMACLKLAVSCSWKGDEIKEILEELSTQIGGIKYVVADMGNSIKKALRLASIPHVEDITHKISWFIKELYKGDDHFKSYTKKLAHLRGVLGLSNLSHILPPRQRSHSRFMNLKPIFGWGVAILKMLESDQVTPAEREKMMFIKEYETLIVQTHQLIMIANQIQSILKNHGLSQTTRRDCLNLFEGITDQRILKFKDMIETFLTNKLKMMEGESEQLLCSSDILESSFGKYKGYISDNISVGITDLSLSIPAFSSKLGFEEVTKAMEEVKVEQIKKWSMANIGNTQVKKRQESLKTGRRKKSSNP